MQWHMYNVITKTRRNNVCDNSFHLYYSLFDVIRSREHLVCMNNECCVFSEESNISS